MDRYLRLFLSGGCADDARDLQVCKLLYIDLQKKSPVSDFSIESLETALLRVINDDQSDRIVLEMACKVYFLLLAKKYNQIDLKSVTMKSPRNSNFIVRGILATNYDFINPSLLYNIILTAVEKCLEEHSTYTTIALNNLRLFCLSYKNFNFDFPELWRIVALHLSSRFIGARDEALNILQFIVKFDQKFALEIARLVVDRWPWTYANKYYVLLTIMEGFNGHIGLLESLTLRVDELIQGLFMALQFRILFSPGQLLFRCLLRKDQQSVVTKFLRELIARRDTQLLHNFHVQWSKEMFHYRDEIFEGVEDDEGLQRFDLNCRIIVVNIFKEHLIDRESSIISKFPDDPVIQQHYFDILLFRVSKQFSLSDDLRRLNRFFVELRENQDTTLRQHVFSCFAISVANLIQLHTLSCKDEVHQAIETFLQQLISDTIVPGFDSDDPSYSEIILSVRLLEILLKSFHNKGEAKVKATKELQDRQAFKELLEQKKIFNGVSDQNFNHLMRLLLSTFDDIRQLAANILLDYFPATTERRRRLQETFCEQMFFSSFADCCRVHGYFKVLVPYCLQLQLSVVELYEEYKTLLVDSYENHFSPDPLRAISCGIHILDKINIVQEIVKARQLKTVELLPLVKLLRKITERMLHFLSISSSGDQDITPSFQVIDESLQVLINNSGKKEMEWNLIVDESVMEEEETVRQRKDLLASIWMTLKACGDLTATIVEICSASEIDEIFSHSLDLSTRILYRCRHKGVIEAVGLSFGRIVAHVSSWKEFSSVYERLDSSCLKVLFESITTASYSRRGAGFSILVLNLIRNDRQAGKPLLEKLLERIFKQPSDSLLISVNGVFLHYLSMLVRDSSLTQNILPHLNEIASLCLEKIESSDWNVRNAALQLFGALVPKIVGQRQHSDSDWEACQCTIAELQATMPKIYGFLNFCLEHHQKISRTLLIAVLSLLSNVESRPLTRDEVVPDDIQGHLFRLLGHPVEKVRCLSALCFVRLNGHREHTGLAIKLIATLRNVAPNLQHGILLVLILLCQKARLECQSEWTGGDVEVIRKVMGEEFVGGGYVCSVNNLNLFCDFNRLYLRRFADEVGFAFEIDDEEDRKQV